MIETHEPKNGDFAAYVENLSRMPAGATIGGGGLAPGEQESTEAASRRRQVKALRDKLLARQQKSAADSGAGQAESVPPGLFGRSGAAGTAGNAAPGRATPAEAGAAAAGFARLVGRIGSTLVLAGVVLIGLGLMDDPPWQPDFGFAVQVLVMGLVARFISQAIRKKVGAPGSQ